MAKMPCLGCGVVSVGSRCPRCKAVFDANHDLRRGNSNQRGYDYAWQKIRIQILNRDGWACTYCNKRLIGKDATVDHIIALANGGARLDPNNLTSACLKCNSTKSGK